MAELTPAERQLAIIAALYRLLDRVNPKSEEYERLANDVRRAVDIYLAMTKDS